MKTLHTLLYLLLITVLISPTLCKKKKKAKKKSKPDKWEKFMKKADRLEESYNTMQNDDDVEEHKGEIGTESDPAYPEYFNQKITSQIAQRSKVKIARAENGYIDKNGDLRMYHLPKRYECEHMESLFLKECQIFRKLLLIKAKQNGQNTVNLQQINTDNTISTSESKERQLRQRNKILVEEEPKKTDKPHTTVQTKKQRKRRLMGMPVSGTCKPELDNSHIVITTFAAPAKRQHSYIPAPIKEPVKLVQTRMYLPTKLFKGTI